MGELPLVTIIFLTYKRTEYAVRSAASVQANLHYDGQAHWMICDDGSPMAHVDAILDAVEAAGFLQFEQDGYGVMANTGWNQAGTYSPLTLWLEDDWELKRSLDITPYVRLLVERADVGMIRLGLMPIDLELNSVGYGGRMYLNVQKGTPYAFSGNPHLKHERFTAYGPYPTGKNPGDTEIAYDRQIRAQEGPAIWWPLAIGDDPHFGHIGEVQSYAP